MLIDVVSTTMKAMPATLARRYSLKATPDE